MLRRRDLAAGVGLGALTAAALIGEAKADTAFTAFKFAATKNANGATRSQPDRESDIFNVLDFGADPTGVANSQPAIQAAVNALSSGLNSVGRVYFPPGTYLVNSTVNLPNTNSAGGKSYIIEGCGLASIITGGSSFSGYIFAESALAQTAAFTGTVTGGTTLTVSGVTGTIHVGDAVLGAGAATMIASGSGTTWTISPSISNVGPVAMTTATASTSGVLGTVRDLVFMTNNGTPSAACSALYFSGLQQITVERCAFRGCLRGITLDIGLFNVGILNCDFTGPGSAFPGPANSKAIWIMSSFAQGQSGGGPPQAVTVINVDVVGFEVGLDCAQAGCVLISSRFEENLTAIKIGSTGGGGTSSVVALGIGFESNDIAVYIPSGIYCFFADFSIQGTAGNAGGSGHTSTYGFKIDLLRFSRFQGCQVGGAISVAGFGFTGGATGGGITFEGCDGTISSGGGAPWVLQSTVTDLAWTFCVAAPSQATVFANLPGQSGNALITAAAEGMQYNISDCSTSTFLATAAAGGTGAAAHRLVRYNGAAGVWQVIG